MVLQCNSTLAELSVHEDPLWPAHSTITFHGFGIGLSAIFGLISVLVSFYLIFRHATHYLVPNQQRYIIRVLLMIPVYAMVSFLSIIYYKHAVYFQVMRDCYEAFAISSFFTLMCEYVAPGLHEQKKYFRTLEPVNWFWGVFFMQKCTGGENHGPFRKPRSGLTWFNVVWAGIFQYCLVRVLFTIVSVVSEYFNRYCEHSLHPAFAHIWVVCFEGASVTVAMFCLVQFYIQLKEALKSYRPALKIICIKLVIFFSFWQSMVISFAASSSGPFKPTSKISYPDIYIGIPSGLLCIEMAFFAILHVIAFPWTPYSLKHGAAAYTSPGASVENGAATSIPMTLRRYRGFCYAIIDAFNPWDVVKASARGLRWMFVRYRHRHTDSSYQPPPASFKLGTSNGHEAHDGAPAGMTMPVATEPSHPHIRTATRPTVAVPLTPTTGEDDTAGLLRNSARPGHSNSPPRSPMNDEFVPGDDGAAAGLGGAHRVPYNASAEDVWQHNAHPASLQPGGHHPGWDSRESLDEGAPNSKPPGYQTVEGRGWV